MTEDERYLLLSMLVIDAFAFIYLSIIALYVGYQLFGKKSTEKLLNSIRWTTTIYLLLSWLTITFHQLHIISLLNNWKHSAELLLNAALLFFSPTAETFFYILMIIRGYYTFYGTSFVANKYLLITYIIVCIIIAIDGPILAFLQLLSYTNVYHIITFSHGIITLCLGFHIIYKFAANLYELMKAQNDPTHQSKSLIDPVNIQKARHIIIHPSENVHNAKRISSSSRSSSRSSRSSRSNSMRRSARFNSRQKPLFKTIIKYSMLNIFAITFNNFELFAITMDRILMSSTGPGSGTGMSMNSVIRYWLCVICRMIEVLCILLSFTFGEKLYKILCKIPDKCCYSCCRWLILGSKPKTDFTINVSKLTIVEDNDVGSASPTLATATPSSPVTPTVIDMSPITLAPMSICMNMNPITPIVENKDEDLKVNGDMKGNL